MFLQAAGGSGHVGFGPVTPGSGRRALVALMGLAALLWMAALLLVDPVLGRADNGDQYRVLDDAGLRAQDAATFTQVRTRFDCAQARGIPASTASLLGLALARPACLIADELPVQLFGGAYLAIHGLGLLLFLGALARSHRLPGFLLSAALLLMHTTNPYTLSFLNSFYEEAAMISFATLAMGLAAWRAAQAPRAIVEYSSAAALLALAFTKVAHVIFLPLLGWTRGSRATPLVLCLCAGVAITAQVHKASNFQTPNAFNRLFLGLLVDAPPAEVATMLQQLGLADLQRFVGKAYWPEGVRDLSDADKQRVAASAGLVAVGRLYLAHPQTAWTTLKTLVRRTAAASSTIPYLAMSNGGAWAQAHDATPSSPLVRGYQALASHAGAIALLCWAVLLVVALRLRDGYLLTFALLLGACPFIVLLGDGRYEFDKHLLPFLYLSPLAMLLALQALAQSTSPR